MGDETTKSKLEQLARKNIDRQEQLKKSVTRLQESLEGLRLIIKYQAFDLEATRRENTHLRRLLEDNGS